MSIDELKRKAAASNSSDAYVEIGDAYYWGKIVAQDLSSAAAYYKIASDMGSAMGKAMLGQLYYEGQGVPRNISTAKNYLKDAADMKCTHALWILGVMCYKGDYGFFASKGKAFEFWERASKLGHARAQAMIASSYLGDEWGAEKSYKKAAFWYMCAYQNRMASRDLIEKTGKTLEKLARYVDLDDVKDEIIRKYPKYINL